MSRPVLAISADDLAGELRAKFAAAGAMALEPVRKVLDDHYLRTFDYPRDQSELNRIASGVLLRAEDPWLRPYHAGFATEGADDVIRS